jgi:hypothetical protein
MESIADDAESVTIDAPLVRCRLNATFIALCGAEESLIRQDSSTSFHCKGNNQQADPEGNRGECNRLAESPHAADQGSHAEVHSRGYESDLLA